MPTPDSRIDDLKHTLQLQPHPEGGWYREVFRSPEQVIPVDGRPLRQAITTIYFLLEAGRHSRWHKVASDEVWVYLEGDPVELWTWNAGNEKARNVVIGAIQTKPTREPQYVVNAGLWQAARPQSVGSSSGYSLVACMVAPGFDFLDFELMAPGSEEARNVASSYPQLAVFI